MKKILRICLGIEVHEKIVPLFLSYPLWASVVPMMVWLVWGYRFGLSELPASSAFDTFVAVFILYVTVIYESAMIRVIYHKLKDRSMGE